MSMSRDWRGCTAAAMLLLIAIAAVLIACMSEFQLRFMVFNADALYLPALFNDLIANEGRWSRWYLTPAPYLFPDYPIFLMAYSLFDSAFHQMLVYMVLQIGLTAWLASYVARRAGVAQAWWPGVAFALAIAWLGMVFGEPYVLILMSAFHYSVFMFGLVVVGVLLRPPQHGELPRGAVLWAMAAAAYAMALSDALVLVQVIVPVAIWLALRAWARELAWRTACRWAALLVVSSLAGFLSYPLLIPRRTRPSGGFALDAIQARAGTVVEQLMQAYTAAPVLIIGMAAGYLLAAFCLIGLLRRRSLAWIPQPVASLLVLALVVAAVNLAAALPMARLDLTPRYFIPVACLPILILAIWSALGLQARAWMLAFPATLAIAGLISTAVTGVSQHGFSTRYEKPELACVDAALDGTGLRHGLGFYWNAKFLAAFSRHDLQMAQYLNSLDEFRWITSSTYYRPAYDFAVVDNQPSGIEVATIERVAGVAQRRVDCGVYQVLIYGEDGLRLSGK